MEALAEPTIENAIRARGVDRAAAYGDARGREPREQPASHDLLPHLVTCLTRFAT